MAKAAVEHVFTGATGPISSYDKTKTMLGTLMRQNTGPLGSDKWVGPNPVAVARPMEQSTAIPAGIVHVVQWSPTIDLVFLGDAMTAAATRRVVMYEYNRVTNTYAWKGFITLNFATATGTKTIRGLRAMLTQHSTGTVQVSGGTAVTGAGTQFVTDRIADGARIGFGTTDPTQVTQWYDIAMIAGENGINLAAPAPDMPAGTPYVIEELRIALTITSSTLALGSGLFIVKGLHPDVFTATGTTINDAVNTDNNRGIYWLADAAVVTNTISTGLVIDTTSSPTQHFAYVINGTTAAVIYKYNLRAALGGLAFGKTTSAFVFVTGSAALVGTLAASNNGRMATLQHGPGTGVKCLYFVTGTRVYRCVEAGILGGSVTFLTDAMIEIPPGGINTFAVTSAFILVDYTDALDRLIIMTSGAAGVRSYITRYNTAADQFDHIFLMDTKQFDQSAADARLPNCPSITASAFSVWSEDGIFHMCRLGTVATTNQLYAVPFAVDWTYAASTNQRVITPELPTPQALQFYKTYISNAEYVGSDWAVMPTEPFRLYARTSGIDDNSGAWSLVPSNGDLSGLAPSSSIQFMLEFRLIGTLCLTGRVYSVALVYEDGSTDSHYQPSVKQSDLINKRFAWRFATAFGSLVPNLRLRLYDAVSGAGPLVDDTTASPSGTWEKSVDGGLNWTPYDALDKINELTYIRYTPTALGDNIKVRAVLMQA